MKPLHKLTGRSVIPDQKRSPIRQEQRRELKALKSGARRELNRDVDEELEDYMPAYAEADIAAHNDDSQED